MPIYAYRCANCGHAQDVLQKMSDPLLTKCPACGADAFSKQVTAAGFQLKGSGWYVTDFRGGKKSDGEAKAGAKGEAQADSKTDAKAESKSDVKSEAKSESAAKAGADGKTAASAASPAAAPASPAPPPAAKS